MRTRISDLLATALPILLGPMRLVTDGKMAAHVSNAGGFGQIAASGLSGDRLRGEIRLARRLTDNPFGVNIPLYRSNAMEAVEIAAALGVRTITTSAGDPAKIIATTRTAGMTVLHKVSSVSMARKAQAAGVDAVIATGYGRGILPIRVLKNPTTRRLADPDRSKEDRQLDRHGEAVYLKAEEGGVGLVPCGQNAGLIHEIYDIRRVLSTLVDEARTALELTLAHYEGEPPWTTST